MGNNVTVKFVILSEAKNLSFAAHTKEMLRYAQYDSIKTTLQNSTTPISKC
jgi:hypothetical protein